MNSVIIYATKHQRTKIVVQEFIKRVNIPVYNVINIAADLEKFDFFIFFCPTYGDEELPESMEQFLLNFKLLNKKYTICELGNYYGYDDYQFGALKIINYHLNNLGWQEVVESFSLDSLPRIDWDSFKNWENKVYSFLN